MKILVAMGIVLVLAIAAFVAWRYEQDARQGPRSLKPYLTEGARQDFRNIRDPEDRTGLIQELAARVRAVEQLGWKPRATAVRRDSENRLTFVYRLERAATRLGKCLLDRSRAGGASQVEIEGTCKAFVLDLPDRQRRVRWSQSDDAPIRLSGGTALVGRSARPIKVDVPCPVDVPSAECSKVQLRGLATIDGSDLVLEETELLVPVPFSEEGKTLAAPVGRYSATTTEYFEPDEPIGFHLPWPMPEALKEAYQNRDTLEVLDFQGSVRIDLRLARPGLQLEGQVRLLHHTLGHVTIDYYPSSHFSLQVEGLSVPTAIPFICLSTTETLVEFDVQEEVLRFRGGLVFALPESLFCPRLSDIFGIDLAVKSFVKGLSAHIRDQLSVQTSFSAQMHLVWHLGNQEFCVDVAADRWSVLRGHYNAKEGFLDIQAPISYSDRLRPAKFLSSATLETLQGISEAKRSFPEKRTCTGQKCQCWPGDPGPRTDLDESLLIER